MRHAGLLRKSSHALKEGVILLTSICYLVTPVLSMNSVTTDLDQGFSNKDPNAMIRPDVTKNCTKRPFISEILHGCSISQKGQKITSILRQRKAQSLFGKTCTVAVQES